MGKIFVNARFLTQRVSGVQRFAIEISRRMRSLCDDVVFVAPRCVLDKDLAVELGVVLVGRSSGHLWEQVELPCFLNKMGGPLLLNFCNTAPVFYENKISTIHDLSFYNSEWFSRGFSMVYKYLIPRVAKTSKALFTGAEYIKVELIGKYSIAENIIYLVKSAGSNSFFKDVSVAEFDFEYVLVVGSVEPRKNLNRILEVFESYEGEEHLVIVGSKNSIFKDGIDSTFLAGVENIHFTGYVTDERLRALYSGAKLFFYPSLYEGFGIPPIEAQSCGCPVLTAKVTSLPEVCDSSAIYCDPTSVSDMKEKLLYCLSSVELRNDLTIRGYKNIERFSWDRSARDVLNFCQAFL